MPYTRLYYHLIWATKERAPLLEPEVEAIVYRLIRRKARLLETKVFALNGTLDHVHLVVALPATLAVAAFTGQVKAYSATTYNKTRTTGPPLYWQTEYAALSADASHVPSLVAYVRRQKQRLAAGRLHPVLERTAVR